MKWSLISTPIILGVLFYPAIPPVIYPYSIADAFLMALSTFSVLFARKSGMLFVYVAIFWFSISSILGSIQGFDTSIITAMSLGLKWAGALTLYFLLTSKKFSTHCIVYAITFVQIFVLLSLLVDIRPFADSYYSGSNGIFQSSADGGFYLLCSLGFFLNAYKAQPTKLNALNIFISTLSLFLVDSRFAAGMAGAVLFYQAIANRKLRHLLCLSVFLVSILVIFDVIAIPPKLYFFNGVKNTISSTSSDLSMLIRVNNFVSAFDMTSLMGYLVGNGAGFFKLNVNYLFFDQNYSLDNSYIYLFLSFGIPGFVIFILIFISSNGFRMGSRGSLTFLSLTFPLMQDCFSNSFCLLALAIYLSLDTLIANEG